MDFILSQAGKEPNHRVSTNRGEGVSRPRRLFLLCA